MQTLADALNLRPPFKAIDALCLADPKLAALNEQSARLPCRRLSAG